ncbi:MAG: recombinase family protein, partial [Clostridia bacterium]|nr:recombinase family protein [Clostridia bacterium]
DEGKSGTSKKGRKDFNRMLKDAYDKKFDLILCASVSRFARNVADFLEEVTNLKVRNPDHPVGVYFETENVYTLDERDADKLDLQAMFADWESRNKSRRMILSYDQRIFTCQFPVSDLLGYRHTRTGKLVMIPEEAKTVRLIFLAFFCGYSKKEIADMLTEKGRHTLKGKTVWDAAMVTEIMKNERRWGNLQARKSIVLDYKKKKVAKNNGIREGAFVEDHHTGIVSQEIARAVGYLLPNSSRLDGVQDIKVIRSGALKGFINVNPYWNAVNNKTFLDLCSAVYDPEELERIRYESKILSGEEHSKLLSMELSEYQIPYGIYFLSRNMPSIILSKTGFTFNGACFKRLNECGFIEVLYHPVYQMIAIRACSEQSDTGLCWKKKDGGRKHKFRAIAFMEALYERMNWIEDLSFQFRGVFRERGDSRIIFFSLDEPRIRPPKSKVETDYEAGQTEDDLPIRYIKYKKGESLDCEQIPASAYPLEWEQNFGLSYAMRKRRDRISETIEESDIQTEGTSALNPLIGSIPTKEQAMEELESLLIEM